MTEYCLTSLCAQSWQYRNRRKPEELCPTLIEWIPVFFIVHGTIDSKAHSRTLHSLEHCISTTQMTNIRPGRDSITVPLRFELQPDPEWGTGPSPTGRGEGGWFNEVHMTCEIGWTKKNVGVAMSDLMECHVLVAKPPANERRWLNVVLMLGRGHRRWTNNKPILGQWLLFALNSTHHLEKFKRDQWMTRWDPSKHKTFV